MCVRNREGVNGRTSSRLVRLAAARTLRVVLLPTAIVAVVGGSSVPPGPHPDGSTGLPVPSPSSITRILPPAPGSALTAKLGPVHADLTFNVLVNSNPATLTRVQVEPGIASNPADPLKLVAAFADAQNGPVFDFAPGVARSVDGGITWAAPAGGPVVPNPPGFIWGNRTLPTHLAAGDSAVAWGLGNTVYVSTLGYHNNENPPNGDCATGGLYVYRSDDAGDTWTLPANGPAIANTQTIFRDKEYIAADANPLSPFAGNVYMAWDDDVYSGCPQFFGQNFVTRTVSLSVSTDGAATWSVPITLASGCLVAPVPVVAANGDVYVVWYDCNAGVRMLVRKSSNGGFSFGPTVAAAAGLTPPPNPLIGSSFRVIAAFPSIATDPTNADNVYVTWSSNNGPSQTDVFVSRSLNAGTSWGLPVRVNDDALGNPRDQFFPWMAVGADGTIRVMWGDDRLDLVNPGGKDYDIFMAESTDQGASFGPNFRVSTASSNPDFDGFGGTFIGDYFGLCAAGAPVWDDMRELEHQIYGAPAVLRVPSPYATIQAAINASFSGQAVVLDDGVYTGPGNVNLDFGGKAITVRSAGGDPALCIIDCQNMLDTRGFNFTSGETSDAVVQGITIRNGLMTGINPNDRGAAMHIANSSPTVRNCVFESNTAQFGGAVLLFASSPTFTNCVFRNNFATDSGGGINSFGGGSEMVTNCTFSGNSANTTGGAVATSNSLTLVNCILWGDSPNEIVGASTVSYSDVQGGFAGIGNIAADPQFVNAAAGDLRLANISPSIDAGDNTAVPAGILTDLDGSPRFVDRVGTPDTGNPDGVNPIVDMGPYEHQPQPCPWDVDGSGTVTVPDLLLLLASWGLDPGGPPDFDGDGVVAVPDLLQLLAAWGPCP